MILKNDEIKYIFIRPVKRYEVTFILKDIDENGQPPTIEMANWRNIQKASEYCIDNNVNLDNLHDTISIRFNDDGTTEISFQK